MTRVSANTGGTGTLSPVIVTSGWAYAVRPPTWPIGNTPRVRGGVRLTSAAREVHVVFYAAGTVERVFCLGGRDATGKDVPCVLNIEMLPASPNPQPIALKRGSFVEWVNSTTAPSALAVRQFDSLPPSDPISLFLASVTPGGSGGIPGGGVGG